MTAIEELIQTTLKLSNTLSWMADNYVNFGVDTQQRLEIMAWEMQRHSDDLKELKYYIG